MQMIPMIAMGVISASQQASAGKIKEIESKTQAKQIETEAAQREADRKERLARAVSTQMARGGASGASFEGSPLSVIEESQRREEVATGRDELMASVGALRQKTKGKVASSQAKAGALTSLLKTGVSAASI